MCFLWIQSSSHSNCFVRILQAAQQPIKFHIVLNQPLCARHHFYKTKHCFCHMSELSNKARGRKTDFTLQTGPLQMHYTITAHLIMTTHVTQQATEWLSLSYHLSACLVVSRWQKSCPSESMHLPIKSVCGICRKIYVAFSQNLQSQGDAEDPLVVTINTKIV